ncbi:hypothetical protein [Mucilaginibacter phyllosphaerae]|uniref:Uncharacterized protein n=1 Tax=Mucilaginibacter phyllosphaerae TaxID=1812349 RepID=A0A4Y8AB33_9SPHI|nr:hypothetical protein [Mucilaginibacter phyllosphaerae]MBB3969453.1 hypothetical protein [Mucilaginibacter phyllosphaerae]TEW65764.1 hypothetical protein E2R65_11520 [Mucilaginibacter phyllosphaerae]GGH08674.1 hypothetical protein GCM10007352_13830 [Mucilaginibacter phyllosphaerae]
MDILKTMKKLLALCFVMILFAFKVSAQSFSAQDFNANLGKTKTLCDVVSSVKIFSDTLTLINMGGNYPNQKYTIAVKGNKITLDWANLKGRTMCVTGVFEMHKNRPEIVAAQPGQIEVR